MLAHLVAASVDQPPRARLECLITAWRLVPAREIAVLIDEASLACRAGQASLDGDTPARKAGWTAVAAQSHAADLERLVESLIVRDEKTCATRLRALAAMPKNPRLTTALLDAVEKSPFPPTARRAHSALEEALLASGDPRLRDETVAARLPLTIDRGRLRARIPEPRPLDPAEHAAIAQVAGSAKSYARAVAREREQDGALRRAIYERPNDDAPRAVYSDWLTERGDSRGELIALQLASTQGQPSRRALARERELLAEFGGAWLGSAAPLVVNDGATFERGFLVAARLERPLDAGPMDDVWRTCAEIDFSKVVAADARVLAMLDSEALAALDCVLGARLGVFQGLASCFDEEGSARPAPLRARLRVLGSCGPLNDLDAVEVVAGRFPRLEELVWFDSGDPARLFTHVLGGSLVGRLRRIVHRQAASSKGKDVHETILERVDADEERWALRVAFGGSDAISIHVAVTSAAEVISAIGSRVTNLAIELRPGLNRALLGPLERAAARVNLTVT